MTSASRSSSPWWLHATAIPDFRSEQGALARQNELTKPPVIIANDADCFALSEATDGAGASAKSVFAVIIGTGCGGGWVINGGLVSGPNAIAGEWGHNPLPWRTDQDTQIDCYCGQKGCLETLLSGPGLRQQALAERNTQNY